MAETELGRFIPAPAGSISLPPPFNPPTQRGSHWSRETLETLFVWYWILSVVGITVFGVGDILVLSDAPRGPGSILVGLGSIVLIAAAVFQSILLFQFWSALPVGARRTSPGKAVGFLFIPFFGFYWLYIAYWGLAKDLNSHSRKSAIEAPVTEPVALAYCILGCLVWIPIFNLLFLVAQTVLGIVLFREFTRSSAATIEAASDN